MKKLRIIKVHLDMIQNNINIIWNILKKVEEEEGSCNEGTLTEPEMTEIRKKLNEIDNIVIYYRDIEKMVNKEKEEIY